MKLVVGLGNLGPRYARTRHNAGFMVVDELTRLHAMSWQDKPRYKAQAATGTVETVPVTLLKPQTMMNASGEAVQRAMQDLRLAPCDIWVVFDDVDTPFGKLRLRHGGGSSGHQGIKSIIGAIGPDFVRVKFGVSLNDRAVEPSEVYVLKPFTSDEQVMLPRHITATAEFVAVGLVADTPDATIDL